MFNYHKIISIGLALLYLVVLQTFSNPVPIFRFLLPAFLGVLLLTFLYNRAYTQLAGKYNLWITIRPMLLETAGFFMFLFLPNDFYRGLFLSGSVALIAIFEITLLKSSENVLLAKTLVILFAFCFAFAGMAQYFPFLAYAYLAGVFLVIFLVARGFYEFVPHGEKEILFNSLVVGFLGTQIFWAANLLPFHYSVLGLMTFLFLYVIFVLNFYFLLNSLTAKQIKYHLALAAACLVLVLSATPWTIIN